MIKILVSLPHLVVAKLIFFPVFNINLELTNFIVFAPTLVLLPFEQNANLSYHYDLVPVK